MTPRVGFQQCVDRSLVHRRSVSEVFITDLVETGPDTCLIGAQLPMAHVYFLDSARSPAAYGPTLLAECARQACTYLAHRRYRVPLGWCFLMAELALWITDPDALTVGERPAELTMLATTDAVVRAGRLRALTAELELELDGRPVARITGQGRYLDSEEYEFLRSGDRPGGLVPMSHMLPARMAGIPVPPRLVGRGSAANVLLADARSVRHGVEARLHVLGTHPTIFDHPLDHYPGMALMEAATQATLLALALHRPDASPDLVVSEVHGVFTRFAELDAQVRVLASIGEAACDTGTRVTVTFDQRGAQLAEFRMVSG